MKLVSHYLQSISDVGFFPSISLLIFFLFFAGIVWWVVRGDKSYFRKMESFALEEEEQLSSEIKQID
ncbi:MAG: cbb3-type cytochrome c oxidase subunit 3 [Marinifilaceae bacterium]